MTKEIIIPAGISDLDASIFLTRLKDKATGLSREYICKVRDSGSWSERFSSWTEYVESPDGLGKSKGYVSRLTQVHDHFFGKVSHEKLEKIDNDCLYYSMRLNGTPEKQLASAELLTRRQIQDELASTPAGDCQHDCEHITICSRCSRRV